MLIDFPKGFNCFHNHRDIIRDYVHFDIRHCFNIIVNRYLNVYEHLEKLMEISMHFDLQNLSVCVVPTQVATSRPRAYNQF